MKWAAGLLIPAGIGIASLGFSALDRSIWVAVGLWVFAALVAFATVPVGLFLTSRQRERDRPRFDCRWVGTGRRETAFAPNWKIKQIHGEQVDELHWRVRGPRFGLSDWTILRGQDIEQATVTGEYDLTVEICADEFVEPNQVGLELRFRWKTWRRNWGHELHFWPIEPAEIPGKTLWDHLNEDFPPRRFETRGHR